MAALLFVDPRANELSSLGRYTDRRTSKAHMQRQLSRDNMLISFLIRNIDTITAPVTAPPL